MVFPEQASDREKRRYAKYFESLPSKLKRIILAHKMSCENKKCNQGLDRILILHGPPSSGKTEGCKAIAHKLNVPYIYFSAPSFGTTYQNSAVQNIKILIEPLLREELPLVVIIDEISALTKGADGDSVKDSETEQYKTSCSLNTLLDRIRQNEYVLLLCTTNDVGFVTEPILQRSRRVQCESSPSARMEKFKDELLEDGSRLDKAAQNYLEEKKETIANYTFRDIEQFIKSVKQICWERQNFSDDNLIITKNDIEVALKELESDRELIKDKKDNAKSEQQKMHEENIRVQVEIHNQNMRAQQNALLLNSVERQYPGITGFFALLSAIR